MSEEQKPLPSTILENRNMMITVPCPTAQGKWSNLYFRVFKGNPRLYVRTNDPNDKINFGTISVPMTPVVWETFLQAWETAVTSGPSFKTTIECDNFTKGSKQAELLHKIIVGTDAEGIVSIMVIDNMNKERPRIKFEVGAPRFVEILKNNEPLTRSEKSIYFSKVWLNILRNVTAQEMVRTWEKPAAPGGGRGGWGNNQNRGNYQNNNYQNNNNNNYQNNNQNQSNSSASYDDDIPF